MSQLHTSALRQKALVAPAVVLEWAPGQVELLHHAQGRRGTATTVAELRGVLAGQKEVWVGVARSAVFLRTLRLPRASSDDLRSLIELRIGQLFPIPPSQLAYDFYQTEDQNVDGVLTLIVAMRSQDLQQLNRELKEAGVSAARIIPAALGAVEVAQQAGVKDALVVGNALGGQSLDVVQGGVVRLSRTVSSDEYLTREGQRTLAAAGASDLPWVTAEGLSVPGARQSPTSGLAQLHRAAPVAFELTEDRLKTAKKRIAGRTRLAVLMTVSALLLATLIWDDQSKKQAVARRGEGVWARELSKLRSIRDAKNKEATAAGAVQNTLKTAFEAAQPLSDIAAVVGDSLPPSAWLTGMSLERGKPLQIRGTASQDTDVARFVEALGSNKRFRDVKLVFANGAKIENKPVVQFSVTAVAVGNLPMPTAVKKSSKTKARTTSTKTGTAATGTTGDSK